MSDALLDFVHRLNLERFRALIEAETDPDRRSKLEALLAREEIVSEEVPGEQAKRA